MKAPDADRKHWWSLLSRTLEARSCKNTYPVVILADFNASIGSDLTRYLSDCHAATENANGSALRKLSSRFHLYLPATFQSLQVGDGHTFTHPSGSTSRKDYILVSDSIFPAVSSAYVDTDIDLAMAREDHKPAVVELSFAKKISVKHQVWPIPRYHAPALDQPAVAAQLHQALRLIPNVPWEIDPDTHANYLSWQFLQCLQDVAPIPKIVKRSSCISDPTWNLIQRNKDVRKKIRNARKVAKTCLIQCFFDIFRDLVLKPQTCEGLCLYLKKWR